MTNREVTTDDLRMLLDSLGQRPIAFQPAYSRICGSVVGGLMLSQAMYWSDRTRDPDGWFYKSREQWEDETGLSRSEQERARRVLKTIGVLEEERRGLPARLYFRVDRDRLGEALIGVGREVSLDDVLTTYRSHLTSLSRTGLMRARKLGVEAEYTDYAEVLKRDGMTCGICGEPIRYGPGSREGHLHFDHRVPLSAGGAHTLDNIRPAHAQCNTGLQSSRSSQDQLGRPSQDQPDGLRKADIHTESTAETTGRESTSADADTHAGLSRFEMFELFWKRYPKGRGSKKASRAEWDRLKVDAALFEDILYGLELWKGSDDWRDPKYIRHCERWLKAQLWENPPLPETQTGRPPKFRDTTKHHGISEWQRKWGIGPEAAPADGDVIDAEGCPR